MKETASFHFAAPLKFLFCYKYIFLMLIQNMTMRLKYFIVFLLTSVMGTAYAIKPIKQYDATPETWALNYTDHTIASGKVSIHSWLLAPEKQRKAITILISNSDFGNMGYLLYYGRALYEKGYDVILYDYRGFGSSSDFAADSLRLFSSEYTDDLSSVYSYYHQKNPKQPIVFMGLSMGTIVTTAFLGQHSVDRTALIFDGFIQSIDTTIARIGALKQRHLTAPLKDATYRQMQQKTAQYPRLIFSGKTDPVCPILSAPVNATVVPFDGGHLEALKVMTSGTVMGNLYFDKIESFIDEHL